MATVCGASLALMDAGVPMTAPVGGVAMGLVKEGDDYAILTDIAGAEDHYGDMDFKVAGTRDGITALQMDIKVPNITAAIMREALEQARAARLLHPRQDERGDRRRRATAISQYAPRIYTLHIPTDKIRDLIGPGGKMIRSIIEQTGVKIDVEDDGTVHICVGRRSVSRTRRCRSSATSPPSAEVGKTYLGKVVRLADFGAFVEIFPGTDGLLHISEIAENRIKRRSRRAEGRRPDPGQGPGARRQQDQAEPESGPERTAREAEEGTSHATTGTVSSFDRYKAGLKGVRLPFRNFAGL